MPARLHDPARPRPRLRRAGSLTAGALATGAFAAGTVALWPLALASPAGAALRRASIGEQACFNTGKGYGWSETLSGPEQVGSALRVTLDFTCTTSSGDVPLAGLPTVGAAAPPGVAALVSPAAATTSPAGAVTYVVRAKAPGRAALVVTVHDGGLCASDFGPSGCVVRVGLTEAAAPGLPPARPAKRVGIIPPANPPQNAPEAAYDPPACTAKAPGSRATYNPSVACADYYLARINAAAAKEHVPPMRLPSNWASLTVDEQLFVMADLERVSRGLPPYVGLSVPLNALAQAGAVAGNDPNVPAHGYYGASSNWAGNSVSAADADYEWVYVDGWGGSKAATYNADCTSPHASGCWGHRDDVLGQYTGLECTDCVMGAGAAFPSHNGFDTSLTELFVEPTHAGVFPVYFTWAKNVLPYLPR